MTLKIGEKYREKKNGFVGILTRAGIIQNGNPIPRAVLERRDESGAVLKDWEGPETMLEELDGSAGSIIELPAEDVDEDAATEEIPADEY